MRILQLVSDWKWTGPAEPMLVLMGALRERGHQVDLVCPEPPPGSNRSLWQEASNRNLDPIHAVIAHRSALALGDAERVRRLRLWLETDLLAGPYDIVHCWHSRDHVLAARALGLGIPGRKAACSTRLIRFLSRTEKVEAWPWNRWLLGPGCHGLVCASDEAANLNRPLRRGRLIAATSGAVDFDGLRRHTSRVRMREEMGVPQSTILIGVVARMQPHRRFDLLFEALGRVVKDEPDIRLVLIGRGTREEEVARKPVRELGLSDHVIFAGYRVEDYADVLGALDIFTFLVPGSDGTCRALLQAAAIGLPLVGSNRGAIPDIISNGQTGLVISEGAGPLAAAWTTLIRDPARCREMGQAAGQEAAIRFRPDRFAAWMERFYEESASLIPMSSR